MAQVIEGAAVEAIRERQRAILDCLNTAYKNYLYVESSMTVFR